MSKIEDRLKALKAQEEKIRQEGFKIQFLQHILDETKNNKLPQFKSIKNEVVSLLQTFVDKAVEAIESEETLVFRLSSELTEPQKPIQTKPEPKPADPKPAAEKQPQKPVEKVDANTQLSFAMQHRHLSGKKVKVHNPENADLPFSGEVVGLDAPYLWVKTEQGPTIKVPVEKVIL